MTSRDGETVNLFYSVSTVTARLLHSNSSFYAEGSWSCIVKICKMLAAWKLTEFFCRDPDSLNWFASFLVECLTPDQEDKSLNSRWAELDKLTESGRTWRQVFYIHWFPRRDMSCLTYLSDYFYNTCNLAQHTHPLASLLWGVHKKHTPEQPQYFSTLRNSVKLRQNIRNFEFSRK